MNARHIKQVPGRKTDIADAHWLAILARNGLLRGGFVPPVQFRELRVVSRQMQKMTGILSGEKNRLHKVLSDTGIRLGVVVSDLHGKSARTMIKGLLEGETPQQVLRHASHKLKATEAELLDALEGDISPSHYFVLTQVMAHIEQLEQRIVAFQQFLLQGLADYTPILQSLQTIPGIDLTSAAMLLVEIRDDMDAFGSPHKLAHGLAYVRAIMNRRVNENPGLQGKETLMSEEYYAKPPMPHDERAVVYKKNLKLLCCDEGKIGQFLQSLINY